MMMMHLGYCRNSQSYLALVVVADVVAAAGAAAGDDDGAAVAGDVAAAVVAADAAADASVTFDVVLAGWHDFAIDSCTDQWAPYYCVSLDAAVAPARSHNAVNCLHSVGQCPFDGIDAFACNRFDLIVAVAICMSSACTVAAAADMRAHYDLDAYFAVATTRPAIADE